MNANSIIEWLIHLMLAMMLAWMPSTYAQDDVAIRGAVKAAETYLALQDAGKFDEAWKMQAAAMQSATSQEKWQYQVKEVHRDNGILRTRTLLEGKDAPKLVQDEKGKQIELKYAVGYDQADAIEKLKMRLEPDGQYRVASYDILRVRGTALASALYLLSLCAIIVFYWLTAR